MTRTILEIRSAKDSKQTPEATAAFLASISNVLKGSLIQNLLKKQSTITLELTSLNQLVYFVVTCDTAIAPLVKSQVAAQYPTAIITEMEDYLRPWGQFGYQAVGQMSLASPHYFPLKTYDKFATTDPISGYLGVMGRLPYGTAAIIQILLTKAPNNWSRIGRNVIKRGVSLDPTVFKAHPQQAVIEEKLKNKAFHVSIRLLGIAKTPNHAEDILLQIASSFGAYAQADSNALKFTKVRNKALFVQSMIDRSPLFLPRNQYLNIQELASLYHFPGELNTGLRNLTWGKTMKGEPPDNLPVDDNLTQAEREEITFYAKTEYKNRMMVYGLKLGDRRRHFYSIGKSGTGKSTLIAKMAIDDIYKGQGLAVIDPHGDLVEGILLDYIPDHRIQDVVYLDPSITDHPFHINPLEVLKPEYKDLTVSNIMSIFTKLWANVWSARMEYILRNTLATLVEVPGSTFLDLPRLLTDDAFRAAILEKVDQEENRVIHDFWNTEYNAYNDKFRNEAIAPILNKVGQFIASPKIRSIVGYPKSTVNIEELMNTKKIVLVNLSQGKVGEENAALLGAMFITQFQLAAMNRINVPEEQRIDFFLYVDEFQNFATTSFIKILSEARKYRLGLVLANQYTAQLEEPIQKAVFGNVGTIVSFVVGADDATRLIGEYGALYTQDDLVNLGKHQIINKVAIENRISSPFPAYTIPPEPELRTNNRQKVIDRSRLQFTRQKGDIHVQSLRELIPPAPPKPLPISKVDREAKKAELITQIKAGDIYAGKVTSLKDYGAFVEIIPGLEGLVHVSQMGKKFVKNPTEVLKEGEEVKVKVMEIDAENRINLTMKVEEAPQTKTPSASQPSIHPPLPKLPPLPVSHPSQPTASPVKRSFQSLPTLSDLDSIRLTGFRPTVVGCFLHNQQILLVHHKKHNLWQLPQGGVENKHTLPSAFTQKMSQELSAAFLDSFTPTLTLISQDKIEFPPDKQGGDQLATDSGEKLTMKGKHYYFLTTPCDPAKLQAPTPEYDDLLWFNFDQAVKTLKSGTTGGKLRITLNALEQLKQANLLNGSSPHTAPPPKPLPPKASSVLDYEIENEE